MKGLDRKGFSVTGKEEGDRDFGDKGQTCDGAVVVIARDPRQPHAPLGQVRQLQVPGPVGSFCWNGINEAGIVPGASPSSHHLSQPHGRTCSRAQSTSCSSLGDHGDFKT